MSLSPADATETERLSWESQNGGLVGRQGLMPSGQLQPGMHAEVQTLELFILCLSS